MTVDVERDALMQKRQIGGLLAAFEFFGREVEQALLQRVIMAARRGCLDHLVTGRAPFCVNGGSV
jgi:hypothetical protein